MGDEANFRFDDVGYSTSDVLTATETLRYHYDANARVVGRTLNPGVSEVSQFFIYDGDRIIQELDESGNLVAAWDYGVYIDEIFAMHRDTNDDHVLDTAYYYLQDDHYNVIGLTDATGTVVERYAYDDYGAPTIYTGDGSATRTESAYGNPFLFQGRRWDEVLSLYDYRTRYYDPYLGRFLRIDTIGLWGDANNMGNPYAFVGNNPWTHLDPYGEGLFTLILIGDYNSSDWEALKGFGEGATGGATIVADTFTFNSIDALNAKANTYQGAAYTGSRILATVSREATIAAVTGGIGNAAARGGQAAQVAHKGILIYEAGRGGYDVGTGINQIAEGDTVGGIISITSGVAGGAGSFANAHVFAKATSVKPKIDAKGNLHGPDGRFVAKAKGTPAPAAKKVHGNSHDSEEPATLYELYDADSGVFLKWGITSDTATRYSAAEIDKLGVRDVFLQPRVVGPRRAIAAQERYLIERSPGPKNFEKFAGTKAIDASE